MKYTLLPLFVSFISAWNVKLVFERPMATENTGFWDASFKSEAGTEAGISCSVLNANELKCENKDQYSPKEGDFSVNNLICKDEVCSFGLNAAGFTYNVEVNPECEVEYDSERNGSVKGMRCFGERQFKVLAEGRLEYQS